ncbi:MAG: type II toxin-antitoxin system VapB family antitoxin [Balneolaceae bacterium]|nr:type II toxin-antitoxin system VapB family antitoxin [Balneolaceae bacterium]
MRTNIEIEDELMDQVLEKGAFKTKKEAVNEGLKLLLDRINQQKIRDYRGKLTWSGDLNAMRTDVDDS